MKFFIFYISMMIWGFWIAYKKRKEKAFYGGCLGLFIQFASYPFKIPIEFCLIACSLLGAIVLFYKWKVKKLDDSLIFFSVLFLFFGFAFYIFWCIRSNASFPWVESLARVVFRYIPVT
jgi:hypothetical protein